jgi:hypothetical protein
LGGFGVRATFEKLNINLIPDFPKLDTHAIINSITLDLYQLKQAICYINDNNNSLGKYSIEL